MKRLKREVKEWIFNRLLELLFKFANSHKLIKFSRQQNGDKIDYELTIRTIAPVSKSLVDVEKATSEYLENRVRENLPKWQNEGFWSKQARERAETFSVRNGYQTEEQRIESHKKFHEGFTSSRDNSLKEQHENRIELQMNIDGSFTCTNEKEIQQKLQDALKESGSTLERKTLPDGMIQSIIRTPREILIINHEKFTTLPKFEETAIDNALSESPFEKVIRETSESEMNQYLNKDMEKYQEENLDFEEGITEEEFDEQERKSKLGSLPIITVEQLAELGILKEEGINQEEMIEKIQQIKESNSLNNSFGMPSSLMQEGVPRYLDEDPGKYRERCEKQMRKDSNNTYEM